METRADQIPCLPESAPFTPEQRAYLNGFLAGLFSRGPVPAGSAFAETRSAPLLPLVVLFGSQTGNAENLAKRIAKEAIQRGFVTTVQELNRYPVAQLGSEERLIIVTSTFGEGEPPDNATLFWQSINSPAAIRLTKTRFAVCALGDSSYPKFCGFGKDLDARLETLGAQRACSRVDCDVQFEENIFTTWLNQALAQLKHQTDTPEITLETGAAMAMNAAPPSVNPQYSRSNPFLAKLATNRKLNGPGSEKDTRHIEIVIKGSELAYEAGDALGIVPSNCPELVEEMIRVLNWSGEEPVPIGNGGEGSSREALLRHYEITRIGPSLLQEIAERSGEESLKQLVAPAVNGELTRFLRAREIIDLLLAYPGLTFAPGEFVRLLKPLQPRLYSIASSPKSYPEEVHITVNVVRFESLGRRRKGVCSSFLADRVELAARLPVFIHHNKHFRPPPSHAAPMIMVGPGTGIAPFRAFLQERRAVGARAKNWLFFGDQRGASDFMYRDELEGFLSEGVLSRLNTAFSRDQPEKIYVQHRMQENAKDLYMLLEEGAYFYVCGDANRMAKDVDAALHRIVESAGNMTTERALEYIAKLKAEKRYLRDVY